MRRISYLVSNPYKRVHLSCVRSRGWPITNMDQDEQSRIEKEDDYVDLILRLPALSEGENTLDQQALPLGIVLFPHMIITICQGDSVVLEDFSRNRYRHYPVSSIEGFVVSLMGRATMANAVRSEDIKHIDEQKARGGHLLESVPASVDEAYYQMALSSLRRPDLVKGSPITVAYTPLHGTGNVPITHLMGLLGIRTVVVREQQLPDGSFPTVKLPNPESAQAMTKVIALAKAEKADIVIGTDPDADRMTVIRMKPHRIQVFAYFSASFSFPEPRDWATSVVAAVAKPDGGRKVICSAVLAR